MVTYWSHTHNLTRWSVLILMRKRKKNNSKKLIIPTNKEEYIIENKILKDNVWHGAGV